MNYYAQNVQTGNTTAQSSVISTVEGSGSVSTHIEVEANGDKKVLDVNSPGTYSLSVQSNGNQATTPPPTTTVTPDQHIILDSTEPTTHSAVINKNQKNKTMATDIFSSFVIRIEDFFKKLFSAPR
jgi:hypothetical protein